MTQITVNGRGYELVTLDQLTLDEAIVVWDYAKMSLDQIPDLEGFHPGVVAALIHIAIARVERDEKPAAIRRAVGQIRVSDLEQIFGEMSEETDAESPPPPEPVSVPSSPSGASGEGSSATGEPDRDGSPANGSGSPGSATGATSDPVTSAR